MNINVFHRFAFFTDQNELYKYFKFFIVYEYYLNIFIDVFHLYFLFVKYCDCEKKFKIVLFIE